MNLYKVTLDKAEEYPKVQYVQASNKRHCIKVFIIETNIEDYKTIEVEELCNINSIIN